MISAKEFEKGMLVFFMLKSIKCFLYSLEFVASHDDPFAILVLSQQNFPVLARVPPILHYDAVNVGIASGSKPAISSLRDDISHESAVLLGSGKVSFSVLLEVINQIEESGKSRLLNVGRRAHEAHQGALVLGQRKIFSLNLLELDDSIENCRESAVIDALMFPASQNLKK